jgi:broad specificity phosphatase PhoE
MSRLFLIRHGEPETGWGGAQDDPGLSAAGRSQAEAAALALTGARPLAIVSSPMRRCRETAAPYAALVGGAAAIDARVGEVAAPAGVSDRRAWLLENFPWRGGSSRSWTSLDPALCAWREDVLAAVRALILDTAVFTHFIAINVIVGAALARDETVVCKPDYAAITELVADENGLRVVRLAAEMRAGEVR